MAEEYIESDEKYSSIARVLHWLMAFGFLFMWVSALIMRSFEEPLESIMIGLHISIGVSLALLLIIRVAIRFIYSPPPLPSSIPKLDRIGSHIGHVGLYLLPAIVILLGVALVNFGGELVIWFGMELPAIFPTLEIWNGIEMVDFSEEVHELFAWLFFALVVVHIAAVVKHKYFDGHDILHRMTFGKEKASEQ